MNNELDKLIKQISQNANTGRLLFEIEDTSVDGDMDFTRLEIIDKNKGRVFVTDNANTQEKLLAKSMIDAGFDHSFQDDGKTLKIFK
jgi:hypothetical protein